MSPGVTPPSSPSTPSVTSSLPSTAPSSPEDLRLSGEALPVIHYLGTVFSSKSETPVRASRSEEIDEYNPKGVAQFLVDRFKDPQQILAVMNKLMKNFIVSGDKGIVITTPFARIGLTICYDIRFPELYTNLCKY